MTIFCKTNSNQYYAHQCPGCKELHLIPDFQGIKRWDFSGTMECPTLSPSIRHVAPERQCHYFIRDGSIIFCEDCHHDLKGKTVRLPEIPASEMEWLV